MNITFIFGPSATPPLPCDCAGAVVYLRFKKEFGGLSRDYHGTVRGTLADRAQAVDGRWSYVINVHESGLISPTPALSGSMFSTVCCLGCVSAAAEAYNQDEFGGKLVVGALAEGRVFVRHTIRPFLISDWRAWIDTSTSADVRLHLYVDGLLVTTTPLVIEAGKTVSTALPKFITGSTYWVPEGALVEVEVVENGEIGYTAGALGFETWFFGHLNPSHYFVSSPLPPEGGSGGETATLTFVVIDDVCYVTHSGQVYTLPVVPVGSSTATGVVTVLEDTLHFHYEGNQWTSTADRVSPAVAAPGVGTVIDDVLYVTISGIGYAVTVVPGELPN